MITLCLSVAVVSQPSGTRCGVVVYTGGVHCRVVYTAGTPGTITGRLTALVSTAGTAGTRERCSGLRSSGGRRSRAPSTGIREWMSGREVIRHRRTGDRISIQWSDRIDPRVPGSGQPGCPGIPQPARPPPRPPPPGQPSWDPEDPRPAIPRALRIPASHPGIPEDPRPAILGSLASHPGDPEPPDPETRDPRPRDPRPEIRDPRMSALRLVF